MNNTVIPTFSVGRRERLAIEPNRELVGPRSMYVLGFLLLHVPLAILMKQTSSVATLHALVTFALGIAWAASRRPLEQVAYVGAYIAGAEVLWRMTGAGVFWEFGKYATVAIFIVAMLRARRLQGPVLPFFYFVLLLPSTILLLTETSLTTAQELISFNLSGPFALMISAWFFSYLRFSSEQRRHLFLAIVGPILGISAVVLFGILTASSIHFGRSSNPMLSGGYGPNQVSSVLALGTLLSFWYMLNERTNRVQKALMFGLGLLFLVQSVLTFSRGGLYTAAGSAMLAAFYLVRAPRARVKLVFVAVLLLLAAYYVLPRLDAFTGGALLDRYTSSHTSDRDNVVKADLQIWRENPLYGVGPGRAKVYRFLIYSRGNKAHTEQTRMLAEHGLFGLVALLLLLGMAGQRIRQARTTRDKAFVASMVSFSLLYMLHAAMRLVTPAFVFGMTFATFLPEEKLQQKSSHEATGQSQISSRGYYG